MWASASSTSVTIRRWSSSLASRLCARTTIATSVATWSFRERAVWSFPPTGPMISVSRRSIAMWMSSSSSSTTKLSLSISSRTASRPRSICSRSSSPMIPLRVSMRAWASDCSRSYGASR